MDLKQKITYQQIKKLYINKYCVSKKTFELLDENSKIKLFLKNLKKKYLDYKFIYVNFISLSLPNKQKFNIRLVVKNIKKNWVEKKAKEIIFSLMKIKDTEILFMVSSQQFREYKYGNNPTSFVSFDIREYLDPTMLPNISIKGNYENPRKKYSWIVLKNFNNNFIKNENLEFYITNNFTKKQFYKQQEYGKNSRTIQQNIKNIIDKKYNRICFLKQILTDKYKHSEFPNKNNKNYIEYNHILPFYKIKMFDDKKEIHNEINIIPLCPGCHRMLDKSRLDIQNMVIDSILEKYKKMEKLDTLKDYFWKHLKVNCTTKLIQSLYNK